MSSQTLPSYDRLVELVNEQYEEPRITVKQAMLEFLAGVSYIATLGGLAGKPYDPTPRDPLDQYALSQAQREAVNNGAFWRSAVAREQDPLDKFLAAQVYKNYRAIFEHHTKVEKKS